MLAQRTARVTIPIGGHDIREHQRTIGQNHDRQSKARQSQFRITILALALVFCLLVPASALDIEYCSTQNTGSDFKKVTNIYQSHGACKETCMSDYAFAIVQGNACWCSNYAPSKSDSSCNEGCPGYPLEKCGNSKAGAYGYLPLVIEPSGTAGASTKATVSPTSVPPPPPPPPPPPTISTVTEEKEGSVETVTITAPKPSEKNDPTTTPSPTEQTPIVSVVTKVGGFQTVTLMPSDLDSAKYSAKASESASSSSSGISGGAIAGIVVGIVLALLLIIGGILFYRHRQKKAAFDAESHSDKITAGGAGVVGGQNRRRSRSLSTLGLIGEKTSPASSGAGVLTDGISTAPPNSAPAQSGGHVYDPRLDPGTLFMRFDQNTGSSRMSVRSLRDDADYSRRVLRLANPDE